MAQRYYVGILGIFVLPMLILVSNHLLFMRGGKRFGDLATAEALSSTVNASVVPYRQICD
jgi:hypothetical protein